LHLAASSPISLGVMANISKLKMIQEKRRAVSRQIVQQREVLTALETQERDLEIAERVLVSLDAEEESDAAPENVAPPESSGKPDGLPTMPEMIIEALKDAKARGLKGLEPRDITNFIAAKWWPDVKINNVGPIAWRLYKSERLAKRQAKYRLPDDIAAVHVAA
jgi:hypothetical protein